MRAAFAAAVAYVLLFVLLSGDVVARVWDWRWKFESPADVGALLWFEGLRTLTAAAGAVVALLVWRRATAHPAARWLALAVALATVSYAKAAAFGGLPGAVQEKIAEALVSRSPRALLAVIFGLPAWTGWLALAGLTLFVSRHPRPLTSADVHRSGAQDRSGAMRSVALAGADIGGLTRAGAARLLDAGWLRPGRAWLVGAGVAAAHVAALLVVRGSGRTVVHLAALLVAALWLAVLVALFRASAAGAETDRDPLLGGLRNAALAGLALFGITALTAALFGTGPLVAAPLSLAPLVMLVIVAAAAYRTPPYGTAGERASSPGRAAAGSAGLEG